MSTDIEIIKKTDATKVGMPQIGVYKTNNTIVFNKAFCDEYVISLSSKVTFGIRQGTVYLVVGDDEDADLFHLWKKNKAGVTLSFSSASVIDKVFTALRSEKGILHLEPNGDASFDEGYKFYPLRVKKS